MKPPNNASYQRAKKQPHEHRLSQNPARYAAGDAKEPEEIERILDGIPDPTGQMYRFNLAGSLLKASRTAWQKG